MRGFVARSSSDERGRVIDRSTGIPWSGTDHCRLTSLGSRVVTQTSTIERGRPWTRPVVVGSSGTGPPCPDSRRLVKAGGEGGPASDVEGECRSAPGALRAGVVPTSSTGACPDSRSATRSVCRPSFGSPSRAFAPRFTRWAIRGDGPVGLSSLGGGVPGRIATCPTSASWVTTSGSASAFSTASGKVCFSCLWKCSSSSSSMTRAAAPSTSP